MSRRRSISSRLMDRADGLSRRAMPDGGEVFGGPTASRALQAVGARAFTVDGKIIVNDGFDVGNDDDLALYAHEKHHKDTSGGKDDGHHQHDAEEMAARARERLVLQRSRRGDDRGQILGDLDARGPNNNQEADAMFAEREQRGEVDPGGRADPLDHYRRMLEDGMKPEVILDDLATHVAKQLMGGGSEKGHRTSGSPE